MHVIRARNVHEALPEAVRYLKLNGVLNDSRNGPVLVSPEPVATVYDRPQERVLFHPERDANPFFHFYESLWMLAGRRDVEPLTRFVRRMSEFSDDGETFHGAYGFRWRKQFIVDQLPLIAMRLRDNLGDRRQVLQIYSTELDASPYQAEQKDIPCNLMATFQVNPLGALDMVVFNRSNDIVWGCYGANAVHFSYLHEWMATAARVPVGTYTQVSVNWHAYVRTFGQVEDLDAQTPDPPFGKPTSPYRAGEVEPFRMMSIDHEAWDEELRMFLSEEGRALGYRDPFFRRVAVPIVRTHDLFKTQSGDEKYTLSLASAEEIGASDWRLAIQQWIERRRKKIAH